MSADAELSDADFVRRLTPFCERLLELSELTRRPEMTEERYAPHFVGKVLSYSTRLEEFADYCGAKRSHTWFPFRECVAAVKLFSNVMYIVMHLRSAAPRYALVDNIAGFLTETDETLAVLRDGWLRSLEALSALAASHGLTPGADYGGVQFHLHLPESKLKADRTTRTVNDPGGVAVNMATRFLNLFTETEILDLGDEDPSTYAESIPDRIGEASLRSLEVQFHNLQSVYDTRIAVTNIESVDPRLPLIRGHASIVFHLLEAATHLVHFYERHMAVPGGTDAPACAPISAEAMLAVVFGYCLKYADAFTTSSISLCREVIASYAEEGEVEVPVPNYRGFHVRPSTLVAKIVQHYGSNVVLVMDDVACDADLPLELFRVNEKINAEKRKSVARVVGTLDIADLPPGLGNPRDIAYSALHELMDRKRIVSYSLNLEIPDLKKAVDESAVEYVNRVIAKLLAEGKIDIQTDLHVVFKGDKRVLRDLKILADNGYGEDRFGNNVMLPEELSYLRR